MSRNKKNSSVSIEEYELLEVKLEQYEKRLDNLEKIVYSGTSQSAQKESQQILQLVMTMLQNQKNTNDPLLNVNQRKNDSKNQDNTGNSESKEEDAKNVKNTLNLRRFSTIV